MLLRFLLFIITFQAIAQDQQFDIAFLTQKNHRTAEWQIWKMFSDGTHEKRLINQTVKCQQMYSSPKGNYLAYMSDNLELFICNNDGLDIIKIHERGYQPCWSYDETKLLYTVISGQNKDLYLFDLKTKTSTKQTADGFSHSASWFPDNENFAFCKTKKEEINPGEKSYFQDVSSIYIKKINSLDEKLISPKGLKAYFFPSDSASIYSKGINSFLEKISPPPKDRSFASPKVSPKGDLIIYSLLESSGNQLVISDTIGGHKQITNSSNPDDFDSGFANEGNENPIWSPVGSKVAFITWVNGNPDICVASTHDNSQRIITKGSERDENHVWTPNGSQIIYTQGSNVFIMNADGSNKKELNNGRNGKTVILKK